METASPETDILSNGWLLPLGEHIRALDWSPDGQRVVAALADGRLCVVNAETGSLQLELPAHELGVQAVAWSPMENAFASGGEDGRVKTWHGTTGELIREQAGGSEWVAHLTWSPNGTRLATGAGKHLKVWDNDGTFIFTSSDHASSITDLCWRDDGRRLATASYGYVQLFEPGATTPPRKLVSQAANLCLAWSPNGKHMAAGSQERTIAYWKLSDRDNAPLRMSGYPAKLKCLAWDRTSRLLATDGGEIVTVWDVSGKGPAGTKPRQLIGHEQKLTALTFQKRGDILVSGCQGGRVCLWHPAQTDKGLLAAQLGSEITGIKFSPDEKCILVGTADGHLKLIR